MNISIEVLVLLAVFVVFLIWNIIMFITKFIKIRRYKPENDKGRSAEESRRRLADIQRPILSERRSVLPTTNSNTSRQDSPSSRTSGFFKRR